MHLISCISHFVMTFHLKQWNHNTGLKVIKTFKGWQKPQIFQRFESLVVSLALANESWLLNAHQLTPYCHHNMFYNSSSTWSTSTYQGYVFLDGCRGTLRQWNARDKTKYVTESTVWDGQCEWWKFTNDTHSASHNDSKWKQLCYVFFVSRMKPMWTEVR